MSGPHFPEGPSQKPLSHKLCHLYRNCRLISGRTLVMGPYLVFWVGEWVSHVFSCFYGSNLLAQKLITGLAGGSVIKKKSTCQSRGTRVRFLVWKDSICLRAAKPVCATATRVHGQQLWQPARLKPVLQKTKEATAMRRPCTTIKSSSNSLQPEKACAKQSKTQCSQKLINNNNK